jgi:hypothetical protein
MSAGTDQGWLQFILMSEWAARGASAPMRAVLAGEEQVEIGPYVTTIQALAAARPFPSGSPVLNLSLLHDGWKIQPLQLYRPLIYYAAFGPPNIFACLRTSIASVRTIGGWKHDIAVLTRPEDVPLVEAIRSGLDIGPNLHIVPVAGADLLDWCLARYRIDAADIFQYHQPLLYLDVDVVCDAPLNDLCLKLLESSCIEVVPEATWTEDGQESDGHWFGWPLMRQDGLTVDASTAGFSAGILAFANYRLAAQPFAAILSSVAAYAEQTGVRNVEHEQPISNYVMRKLRVASTSLLPGFAQLCRVDPARSPLPVPATPTGLAHFHGIIGHSASKRAAMDHYLAILQARPKT